MVLVEIDNLNFKIFKGLSPVHVNPTRPGLTSDWNVPDLLAFIYIQLSTFNTLTFSFLNNIYFKIQSKMIYVGLK